MLHAWLWYVADRKRKAKREQEALARRQRRLVKEGVTTWLTVASDLAQMRQRQAARSGAQVLIKRVNVREGYRLIVLFHFGTCASFRI